MPDLPGDAFLAALLDVSPIGPEEAEAIIGAASTAKRALPGPMAHLPPGLPGLVLRALAGWHFLGSTDSAPAEALRRDVADALALYRTVLRAGLPEAQVARARAGLHAAHARLPRWDMDPPPRPGPPWLETIDCWARRRPDPRAGRGRRPDAVTRMIFADLLAFAHHVLGIHLVRTEDAQIVALVRAYFDTMRAAASELAPVVAELSAEAATALRQRWRTPSVPAALSAIHRHRAEAWQNMKVLSVLNWMLGRRDGAEDFASYLRLFIPPDD